jgi:hypothetical protein
MEGLIDCINRNIGHSGLWLYWNVGRGGGLYYIITYITLLYQQDMEENLQIYSIDITVKTF